MAGYVDDIQTPATAGRRDPARNHQFAEPPGREWMFRLAEAPGGLLAQMDDTAVLAGITPREAADVPAAARHALTPGILRSVQHIWFSASAARCGAPRESWEYHPSAYRSHDVAACEAEDGA